jgi:hypothetical protein
MKRASSTKVRRECFDKHKWTDPVTGRTRLTCHICKGPIDPAREKWEAEHVIRRVLKESDAPEDVLPAHAILCHPTKTKQDNWETAKGKRVADRHYGIKRSSGSFRKAPPGFKYDWSSRRYVKEEAS